MSTIDAERLNREGDLDRADMRRLAAGQSAALNDLMSRHAQPLFGFLFRMLGNEDDANDVAQEAFVRVYQHAGSFKPEARFNTWLFTIAGNLARNHYRWRSRHPALSLDAPNDATGSSIGETIPCARPAPDQAAASADRVRAVRAAVDALPPELREAIILCEWEDNSVSAAAAILQVKPKAVENRLYRARNLLREKLAEMLKS
jgi:RNA polymerase sigma-70 factor (ECF subfamily)